MSNEQQSLVREHIERCVEVYGQPFDEDFTTTIERSRFEQMRSDLMLVVGMLMALEAGRTTLREAGQ